MKSHPIHIIAAIANNNVIGNDNRLAWHLPDDLKRFKELTTGQTVIMGRKTYESIGKPLPNRTNIIVTHQKNYSVPGILIAHSLEEAFKKAPTDQKIFIIGGASLYQAALPLADIFYLTEVLAEIAGDAYFPQWNRKDWKVIEEIHHGTDEKHAYPFRFVNLRKIGS